jgi:hypothetical protein
MTQQKWVVLLASLAWAAACGGDHGPPPGPGGPGAGAEAVGAACYAPYNCASNYCCASPPCGGGMCTYPCQRDSDCPYGTLCADGACFWACASDANCAPGWACKHAHTVCQR